MPSITSCKPVVTQLCLALADIAIQLDTWANPTLEMIQLLGASTGHVMYLLEFLSYLPEEVSGNYNIPIEVCFSLDYHQVDRGLCRNRS